jgi:2,3-bisphosphoglycerate-independent phosphoglycerate mutase
VVAVLVILDGASEPTDRRSASAHPTSLELARTPVLDGLVAQGSLMRLRTVPPGLPAGSETAIPALLGWTPRAPVDRGAIEAAAYEVAIAAGHRAWRVDVLDRHGERARELDAMRAARELDARTPHHEVRHLAEHRLLVTGSPPLPASALVDGLHPWPEGSVPPRILDSQTTLVAARGAAAGVARLMGASVLIPNGATGRPDTDLACKAVVAIGAIARGTGRVIVHIGGPDEAAHARNAAQKVAVLERVDRELLAPIARAVRAAGGTLRVCPDHGCDPRTGAHDASPVPCLIWPAGQGAAGARLTERAVAELPVMDVGAGASDLVAA